MFCVLVPWDVRQLQSGRSSQLLGVLTTQRNSISFNVKVIQGKNSGIKHYTENIRKGKKGIEEGLEQIANLHNIRVIWTEMFHEPFWARKCHLLIHKTVLLHPENISLILCNSIALITEQQSQAESRGVEHHFPGEFGTFSIKHRPP